MKAKLPLRVRVFTCDACGLVLDRDENAARNLLALAATCITGTGVAGDQDTPRVSNPHGADRETRRQLLGRNTGRGRRAGGANPPHPRRKETGDRRQDTEAQPTPVTPSRTFQVETPGMLRVTAT
ncbi:transposase [Streptomyces sp. AS02]|uniref:transposase n=1 Tax=Streptomyces sp. AS02 TaxID=2938946 RepID=UPI00202159F1|nr:transposase [Streptomyces sp. AS02]MCL8010360.1 transposase [Streptomyces sp. AS02]